VGSRGRGSGAAAQAAIFCGVPLECDLRRITPTVLHEVAGTADFPIGGQRGARRNGTLLRSNWH